MKLIKFVLFLIVIGLLTTLGYQNKAYFLAETAFELKAGSFHYTLQALPNWAYWGICFAAGLLITGIRGLFTAFRLGREIKGKEAQIDALTLRANTLQGELEVFTHDPYIKKALKAKAEAPTADEAPEKPEEACAQ